MKHTVIKNDLLKPKSSRQIATLRSAGTILFLFYWGLSSGQPAISFKESTQAYASKGSANFHEMTIKNLNPVAGSAIYWEFFDNGVWKRYGGTGFKETAEHIGDYRAWYKHGFLGTFTVTNTLTLKEQKVDSENNNLEKIGVISENTSNAPALETNFFANDPVIFPNPCLNKVHIVFEDQAGYTLKVYNNLGVMILTINAMDSRITLETDSWKKGVYIIQVQGNHSTNISKIKVLKI